MRVLSQQALLKMLPYHCGFYTCCSVQCLVKSVDNAPLVTEALFLGLIHLFKIHTQIAVFNTTLSYLIAAWWFCNRHLPSPPLHFPTSCTLCQMSVEQWADHTGTVSFLKGKTSQVNPSPRGTCPEGRRTRVNQWLGGGQIKINQKPLKQPLNTTSEMLLVFFTEHKPITFSSERRRRPSSC